MRDANWKNRLLFGALITIFALGEPSRPLAQTTAPLLSLEFNRLQQTQRGCQLTFVIQNRLSRPLSKAAFEFAFFNQGGVLEKLSVLNFRDVPKGKTKVRQFALKDLKCADLARILINDVTACVGAAQTDCLDNLKTTNRTKIEFGS